MSAKDQYLKFFITFHSVVLDDVKPSFVGKQCLLKYKRGRNELETKKSAIDQGGLAEFNERIEMKTFLEYDDSKGEYKRKWSELHAIIIEGGNKKSLGLCHVDLASFGEPKSHSRTFALTDDLMDGVNPRSHIQLMVDTSIAKDTKDSNRATETNKNSAKKPQPTGNTKNDKFLKLYDDQIQQLKQQNDQKVAENENLMNELKKSNMFKGADDQNASMEQFLNNQINKKGDDDKSKYNNIQGASQADIQTLLELDKRIQKSYQSQFTMTNKNEQMLTDNLSELDDKTNYRDLLFKQVGNKQLQIDIDEIKNMIKKNACAI